MAVRKALIKACGTVYERHVERVCEHVYYIHYIYNIFIYIYICIYIYIYVNIQVIEYELKLYVKAGDYYTANTYVRDYNAFFITEVTLSDSKGSHVISKIR